ncbi:hypothetical protein CROQUDRAFT_67349 [Cronartium quercuum f. sp. fusiforme G11]|uniref:Uncharacterized protein n=1 Tax=Cronartium quercuum f. sp. fusiforme G11 TaxID=708437 RepID=A0A9P6NEP8_9BASI|nr:hypothetical protein CROQUDRAFT_67349 [Cronartium quercuum f. sp. fusiforme G11]
MGDKKSAKLMFKGEKREKKHKKRRHQEIEDSSRVTDEQTDGWLNPPSPNHILGPLYPICINPPGSKPCALAIFPNPVTPIAKVGPAVLSSEALETLEPDDVNHVMVCTRIVDSDTMVTLRVANGRYLATDELGEVTAEREARGVQEEWAFEPILTTSDETEPSTSTSTNPPTDQEVLDGVFAIRSVAYNKYVSVEEIAGGKLAIRCDSVTSADSSCQFLIRMQATELIKAKKRLADERAKKGLLLAQSSADTGITLLKPGQTIADLEANAIQARGAGRLITSTESKSSLKKARKEGRLAEELLDRRAKLKSDRYAKVGPFCLTRTNFFADPRRP